MELIIVDNSQVIYTCGSFVWS